MSFSPESAKARLKHLVYISLLSFALISCYAGPSQAQAHVPVLAPTPIILPTSLPELTPKPSELPVINPGVQTQTLEVTPPLPSPRLNILNMFPVEWNTGEDNAQLNKRMNDTILADIDSFPDQYSLAAETLSPQYLNAVVNIDFSTSAAPWGGTATFIGINRQTNESIYLTDTHVLTGRDSYHIKQPKTGIDIKTSLSQATVASSSSGLFDDISVVKLPFIPEGVVAFPVTGTDLCVSQEPADNMHISGFGFPYINGGLRYTQFFMQGNVETISDTAGNSAKCWYENSTGSLYIPTTMPVRVGASGTLILDSNGHGIALVSAMSPGGAVLRPINPDLLRTLIQQTGFVFEK